MERKMHRVLAGIVLPAEKMSAVSNSTPVGAEARVSSVRFPDGAPKGALACMAQMFSLNEGEGFLARCGLEDRTQKRMKAA